MRERESFLDRYPVVTPLEPIKAIGLSILMLVGMKILNILVKESDKNETMQM